MSQFPPPPGAPEDPYSQNQPGQQGQPGPPPGQPNQPNQGQPYGPPQPNQPYSQPPQGAPYGQPGQPGHTPYGAPNPPYGQPGQQPGGFPSAPQFQGQPVTPPQATDAFSGGWNLFTKNWGPLVGAILVWGLLLFAIMLIVMIPMGVFSATSVDNGFGGSAAVGFGIGGTILLSLVTIIAAILAGAAFYHGALRAVDTGRASFGDFFKFRNAAQVLLLALILGVVNGALSFTFILPIVVSFFTFFALFFVVDRGLGVIDAIKASVDLAMKNAGQTILLMLLIYIASFVGVLLCGVGMLIAGPVTLLASAVFYRALTGPAHQQPVPPSFG